jgi:hypothetical protein
MLVKLLLVRLFLVQLLVMVLLVMLIQFFAPKESVCSCRGGSYSCCSCG